MRSFSKWGRILSIEKSLNACIGEWQTVRMCRCECCTVCVRRGRYAIALAFTIATDPYSVRCKTTTAVKSYRKWGSFVCLWAGGRLYTAKDVEFQEKRILRGVFHQSDGPTAVVMSKAKKKEYIIYLRGTFTMRKFLSLAHIHTHTARWNSEHFCMQDT